MAPQPSLEFTAAAPQMYTEALGLLAIEQTDEGTRPLNELKLMSSQVRNFKFPKMKRVIEEKKTVILTQLVRQTPSQAIAPQR